MAHQSFYIARPHRGRLTGSVGEPQAPAVDIGGPVTSRGGQVRRREDRDWMSINRIQGTVADFLTWTRDPRKA